ncbi:MAG: SDR family oxidoreductase [Planctomycetota bacterium]
MNLALDDKTVWITGASGGIGRALASTFAAEGASLLLHGYGAFDQLESWIAEQPWSARALAVRADVRDPEALEAAADAGRRRFGRLDAVVINAGTWPAEDAPLHAIDWQRLRNTLETNLLGALGTARAFLRGLAADGPRDDGHGASLVFVGSTAGEFGERGHIDYATSKAALVGAMKSLKNEVVALDPFARVNLVNPGWTVTHMARAALGVPGTITHVTRTMALRQLARADDIARTIAWLSSPVAARHVSGQTITVAGGMEGRLLWNADEIDEAAVRQRLSQE